MEARSKLILLYRAVKGNRRIIRQLLRKDPHLHHLFSSPENLREIYNLSPRSAALLYTSMHADKLYQLTRRDMEDHCILTVWDESYPSILHTIPDKPLLLYVKGNTSLLHECPSISIVGTRQPTTEAYEKLKKLMAPLVKEQWLFVSGMAKGIDGMAHQLAMEHSGKTIAVLGSGFDHVYPAAHRRMFEKMMKEQAVISEYLPEQPPKKYQFPERNRIISGLAFGTVVIEAKQKSGSLITAAQALEQGREVFAVPGSPLSTQTEGCHQLIQDGASLVYQGEQLLKIWEETAANWHHIYSRN